VHLFLVLERLTFELLDDFRDRDVEVPGLMAPGEKRIARLDLDLGDVSVFFNGDVQ